MGEDDVITLEDLEDILDIHRRRALSMTELERMASTINYAIDKILSKVIEKEKSGG